MIRTFRVKVGAAAFTIKGQIKAAAPTVTLKVLINFEVGLVTSYQQIITNFNKKVNLLEKVKEAAK